MSDKQGACYTFEAAVEMAIKAENDNYQHYLEAIRTVTQRGAREILRDAALDGLRHKFQLEKALIEGFFEGSVPLSHSIPIMNLDYLLKTDNLSAKSDSREALAYAIHLEKALIDFYRGMVQGCEGAPMAGLFSTNCKEKEDQLEHLEKMYEEHFLTEN